MQAVDVHPGQDSGADEAELLPAQRLAPQHRDLVVVLQGEGSDPGVEVVDLVLFDDGVGEGDVDDGLQVRQRDRLDVRAHPGVGQAQLVQAPPVLVQAGRW